MHIGRSSYLRTVGTARAAQRKSGGECGGGVEMTAQWKKHAQLGGRGGVGGVASAAAEEVDGVEIEYDDGPNGARQRKGFSCGGMALQD